MQYNGDHRNDRFSMFDTLGVVCDDAFQHSHISFYNGNFDIGTPATVSKTNNG